MSKTRTVILPEALTQAVLRETIEHCATLERPPESDIYRAFSSRLAVAVQMHKALEGGLPVSTIPSGRARWTDDGRLAVDLFD